MGVIARVGHTGGPTEGCLSWALLASLAPVNSPPTGTPAAANDAWSEPLASAVSATSSFWRRQLGVSHQSVHLWYQRWPLRDPKATKPARTAENFDVGFELISEQLAAL